MRILKAALVCLFLMPGMFANNVLAGEPLTLDEIITKYIEAIGGRENIEKLQNLVYKKGLYREGDFSSDKAAMSVARPYFKLVGDKSNLDGYLEGYDGSAWEYFGDPKVVVRTTGNPSAAIRHYAGVERPLYNYKAKGSNAEYLGEGDLDGVKVYIVKLTRRDGYVEHFYINRETFLVDASGGEAPIHAFGEAVGHLTRISDYRPLAGVLIAHRFETVEAATGEPLDSMQWQEIEANADLPGDWFSPPVVEQTAEEKLIQSLYDQRTDFTAMIWTYEEFRLAYPDFDTSTALNIAGFQALKMGQVETAVKLLERNAVDNPASAETRFGLGRAYRTAGRVDEAREQFQKALELDPGYDRPRRALAEMEEKN